MHFTLKEKKKEKNYKTERHTKKVEIVFDR